MGSFGQVGLTHAALCVEVSFCLCEPGDRVNRGSASGLGGGGGLGIRVRELREGVVRKGAWQLVLLQACSGYDSGHAETLKAIEALRGSGNSAQDQRIGKGVPYLYGNQIPDGMWARRG